MRCKCGSFASAKNLFVQFPGSKSLDELISSIMQRLGIGGDKSTVQLLVSLTHLTSLCFQLCVGIYREEPGALVSDIQILDSLLHLHEELCISIGYSIVVKHC